MSKTAMPVLSEKIKNDFVLHYMKLTEIGIGDCA